MRPYTTIPFIESCLDSHDGEGDYNCPFHPEQVVFTFTRDMKWTDIGRCCVGRGDCIEGPKGCVSTGGWHEIIRKEYCKAGDHYVLLVFGSHGG